MNGPIVAGATSLASGATLSAVAEAPFLDTPGRVETLFLATLSRPPKAEESARMVAYVEKGGARATRARSPGGRVLVALEQPRVPHEPLKRSITIPGGVPTDEGPPMSIDRTSPMPDSRA